MGRSARALLAAAAVACGAGCGKSTIWLVNGLDVPVKVSVTGLAEVQLAPGERKYFAVPSGTHAVHTVTLDGSGREDLQVEVPGWGGTAVYSVAGAAPLY